MVTGPQTIGMQIIKNATNKKSSNTGPTTVGMQIIKDTTSNNNQGFGFNVSKGSAASTIPKMLSKAKDTVSKIINKEKIKSEQIKTNQQAKKSVVQKMQERMQKTREALANKLGKQTKAEMARIEELEKSKKYTEQRTREIANKNLEEETLKRYNPKNTDLANAIILQGRGISITTEGQNYIQGIGTNRQITENNKIIENTNQKIEEINTARQKIIDEWNKIYDNGVMSGGISQSRAKELNNLKTRLDGLNDTANTYINQANKAETKNYQLLIQKPSGQTEYDRVSTKVSKKQEAIEEIKDEEAKRLGVTRREYDNIINEYKTTRSNQEQRLASKKLFEKDYMKVPFTQYKLPYYYNPKARYLWNITREADNELKMSPSFMKGTEFVSKYNTPVIALRMTGQERGADVLEEGIKYVIRNPFGTTKDYGTAYGVGAVWGTGVKGLSYTKPAWAGTIRGTEYALGGALLGVGGTSIAINDYKTRQAIKELPKEEQNKIMNELWGETLAKLSTQFIGFSQGYKAVGKQSRIDIKDIQAKEKIAIERGNYAGDYPREKFGKDIKIRYVRNIKGLKNVDGTLTSHGKNIRIKEIQGNLITKYNINPKTGKTTIRTINGKNGKIINTKTTKISPKNAKELINLKDLQTQTKKIKIEKSRFNNYDYERIYNEYKRLNNNKYNIREKIRNKDYYRLQEDLYSKDYYNPMTKKTNYFKKHNLIQKGEGDYTTSYNQGYNIDITDFKPSQRSVITRNLRLKPTKRPFMDINMNLPVKKMWKSKKGELSQWRTDSQLDYQPRNLVKEYNLDSSKIGTLNELYNQNKLLNDVSGKTRYISAINNEGKSMYTAIPLNLYTSKVGTTSKYTADTIPIATPLALSTATTQTLTTTDTLPETYATETLRTERNVEPTTRDFAEYYNANYETPRLPLIPIITGSIDAGQDNKERYITENDLRFNRWNQRFYKSFGSKDRPKNFMRMNKMFSNTY